MTQVIQKSLDALAKMEKDLNKQKGEIDNKIDDLADDLENINNAIVGIEEALYNLSEVDQLTLEKLLEKEAKK